MRNRGFTLLELLVVIAIITILGSLLLVSLRKAKASAHAITCINNLRQLGIATHLYANSNDEFLPYPSASYSGPDKDPQFCWFNALDSYLLGQSGSTNKATEKLHLVKQDPVYKSFNTTWKADAHTLKMNQRLGEDVNGAPMFYRIAFISNPANTVLFFDGRAETEKLKAGGPAIMAKNPQGTEGYVARRHGERANVLFLDGHAEARKELQQSNGGLGWALDKTRLTWKPWVTTSASNQ